jgi:uncharacterized protein YndB with AHSA1/START domain
MKSDVKITGNRLQITRLFEAPRALVFSFWSQAGKLQQWSGCRDATACEVVMDFRVGGTFTQKMQLGDKGEFTVTGIYDEIVVPERISYRADIGRAVTRVTVEFFQETNATRVVLTQDGFPDEFSCKMVTQGTSGSLEHLASILSAVVVNP